MFVNTYQSGFFVEVWDSRINVQKNSTYKQLFRKYPASIKNFYDKEVKSFIYELQGNNTKISFPYDDRNQLSLHQQYIVFQLYIPIGSNWSLQLGISDLNNNKKRVNITSNSGKKQLKYFSFRYPLENGQIEKGIWSFLAIDVYSFCNAFKNTIFRSLDHVVVYSSCKLRRIFTMKEFVEWEIPKNYWLAQNIPQTLQLIQYKQHEEKLLSSNMHNSSIQYSPLIQSKLEQIPSNAAIRQLQKSKMSKSPPSKGLKLPSVNTEKLKESSPFKNSKLSQKIDIFKGRNSKQYINLSNVRSNRNLSKADIIIEKSKIRLNSLQEKQEELLQKYNKEEKIFSDKIGRKKIGKEQVIKNKNIFQSDLFKSEFSESRKSRLQKINKSPKNLKIKKKFEEDNIFRQESSGVSQISYFENSHERQPKTVKNSRKQEQSNQSRRELKYCQKNEQGQESINKKHQMQVQVSKGLNPPKQLRQQIIQEDKWTSQQQEVKPQTPIEQMINVVGESIQDYHKFNEKDNEQTIITRQNNKEVILRKKIFQPDNNELQLIYDQMVGCYYHPQANTYYEIRQ